MKNGRKILILQTLLDFIFLLESLHTGLSSAGAPAHAVLNYIILTIKIKSNFRLPKSRRLRKSISYL